MHGWGELDEDAKRIENAETHRLAVCNCDWDRISANDLFGEQAKDIFAFNITQLPTFDKYFMTIKTLK